MTPRTAIKGPASAGPFRVLVLVSVLAVAALALGGCKAKGGGDKGGGGLDESKAAKPGALDPSVGGPGATSTTGPGGGGPGGTGGTGSTVPGQGTGTTAASKPGGGSGGGSTTVPPAPFRTLFDVADRTGDHGLQGKPYGDLIDVRAEDNGASARFTVAVAGDIPRTLAAGETLGLGVNIDRNTADKDSDFQVYALGGESGWLAYYFDGPTQKQFPGTFELGANKVVFVVPWSALGGRTASQLSVFGDWSGQGTIVTPASEDHAPDRGTTPLTP